MKVPNRLLIGYLIICVGYGAAVIVFGRDPAPMPVVLVHGVLGGLLWPLFLIEIIFVYIFCIWLGNTCS
jgi:hypothetical protein